MDGVLSAATDSEVSPKGLYRDHFVKPRLLETAATLAVTPHPWKLEALLPCPGRREIYLREIVCEYVVL